MNRHPPRSPLFPYPTLSRSPAGKEGFHVSVGKPLEAEMLDRAVATHGSIERSEEHTSELQSQSNLVCRLLLEKKNIRRAPSSTTICSPRRSRPTAYPV